MDRWWMRGTDWDLYRAFLTVFEAGSMSRAARASGASQPTLSRQIASIEAHLGVALFERAGQKLIPSPAAVRVAVEAKKMLAAADAIQTDTAREARAMSGTVRVTASEIVACFALPPVLTALAQTHPEIQIELAAGNEVSNLLEREADIAVRMTKPAQSGLLARRLPDLAVGFYAAKSYVERVGTPKTLEELAALRLIGYDKSTLITAAARKAKVALTRDDFAFRCDHQIACWNMARAGLGVGIVACFVGDRDPGMVRLLPKFPMQPMAMWVLARRELKTSARIRAVFDALVEGLPATIRSN
jgi:DNA-binding transcriptional LysR family regulator